SNVTPAVLPSLLCVLLYPLDDSDPEHLMANRRFFEAQMDRFLRPEARLGAIQSPDYR
ncbi:MAG: carbon dioxide transporter, partial [Cyanobium sp.]